MYFKILQLINLSSDHPNGSIKLWSLCCYELLVEDILWTVNFLPHLKYLNYAHFNQSEIGRKNINKTGKSEQETTDLDSFGLIILLRREKRTENLF